MVNTGIAADTSPTAHSGVRLETTLGAIDLELYPDRAPISVANFLKYVDTGFYDNTVFHRSVAGFVVQGGGYGLELREKPLFPPILNESNNGLKNERGTLAMARQTAPNSATSQFYVNLVDNDALNYRSDDDSGRGYAVFGRVTAGMDVVDRIAAVRVISVGVFTHLPAQPVMLTRARRMTEADHPAPSLKE
ncbi:peptidyl-prolyl cis-trans isomerase [Burkholderiaceae bacterium DAT-1]|nr:peptidyl-prolyl cis-trans isomerase [Burkholderiaceae bacterium DAT-1]